MSLSIYPCCIQTHKYKLPRKTWRQPYPKCEVAICIPGLNHLENRIWMIRTQRVSKILWNLFTPVFGTEMGSSQTDIDTRWRPFLLFLAYVHCSLRNFLAWSLAIPSSRLTVFQRAKDILYTCYSSVYSIHLVKQLADCLAFHWIKHILANKGRYPKQKKYNYYMRTGFCVTPALSKRTR